MPTPKSEPKNDTEDGGALPNDILRLLNDNDNPVAPSGPPQKNDPVSCGVCNKDVSFYQSYLNRNLIGTSLSICRTYLNT